MQAVDRAMELAKRPVIGLAGRYGHPLHPALVAVPIGGWIGSFVFDVGSHLVRWIPARRTGTAESRFPVPVVVAPGLFAATTLVLVLLAALHVGGS